MKSHELVNVVEEIENKVKPLLKTRTSPVEVYSPKC
jgi:hypothetical protein